MVPQRLSELPGRVRGSLRFHGSRLLCERTDLKPFPCRLDPPGIVTITFDDFPASARKAGGKVLEAHGARGTYYASFGVMSGAAVRGGAVDDAAAKDQIEEVLALGHEVGCHTFSHIDCA